MLALLILSDSGIVNIGKRVWRYGFSKKGFGGCVPYSIRHKDYNINILNDLLARCFCTIGPHFTQ
jgi:hypothetical protein